MEYARVLFTSQRKPLTVTLLILMYIIHADLQSQEELAMEKKGFVGFFFSLFVILFEF